MYPYVRSFFFNSVRTFQLGLSFQTYVGPMERLRAKTPSFISLAMTLELYFLASRVSIVYSRTYDISLASSIKSRFFFKLRLLLREKSSFDALRIPNIIKLLSCYLLTCFLINVLMEKVWLNGENVLDSER